MTRTQYKRRTIAYWVLLAVYTIVLAVVVLFVWSLARRYALEYENSQPSYVVNEFVETLNQERWNDKMDEAARKIANPFQDENECVQLVKDSLTGDIQLSRISDPDFDTMKYRIICNDTEIGQVYFNEDETQSKNVKFDMLPWAKSYENYDFDYMINGSASIVVPSSYLVKLNGVDVSEDYIVERDIPYDVLKEYYSDYPDLPTKVRYEITGLVGNLHPVAYDDNLNEITIDTNANDSQFLEPCPEEEMSRLRDFTYVFVDAYARFLGTKYFDSTVPTLRQYVKTGSDLDSRITQYVEGGSLWINWTGCTVENISFDGAYSLGGNFYVIDASYETTNYHTYKDPVHEENVKRIVVYDDGNQPLAISVE